MASDRRQLDDMMRRLCREVAREAAIDAGRDAMGLPRAVRARMDAKALAWRIFDTVGQLVGTAIIAGTLITLLCLVRDMQP